VKGGLISICQEGQGGGPNILPRGHQKGKDDCSPGGKKECPFGAFREQRGRRGTVSKKEKPAQTRREDNVEYFRKGKRKGVLVKSNQAEGGAFQVREGRKRGKKKGGRGKGKGAGRRRLWEKKGIHAQAGERGGPEGRTKRKKSAKKKGGGEGKKRKQVAGHRRRRYYSQERGRIGSQSAKGKELLAKVREGGKGRGGQTGQLVFEKKRAEM